MLSVRGNCDVFSIFDNSLTPEERTVNLGGVSIIMMHGHSYSVKWDIEQAITHAVAVGADILLYGHTHKKFEGYIQTGECVGNLVLKKPLRIFNPGLAGGHGNCSFGVIELNNGNILMSWGEF